MDLIRAMKKGIYEKLDGTTDDTDASTFLDKIWDLFYIKPPTENVEGDNFPYATYNFSGRSDEHAFGDYRPVKAGFLVEFHIFSNDETSNEVEDLVEDLKDEFIPSTEIDVSSATGDWENPKLELVMDNVLAEAGTGIWHAIVQFKADVGR